MEKQGPKLVVAPRAGFEPATNRLTAQTRAVSGCLNRLHPVHIFAEMVCIR
jgi:hypothetical protein